MDVVMPQLGETVKEGTVTVWRKKVGERVEANEPLFEVSTDKVETEIPAPVSGVVSAILVAEGSTVQVGVALAVIEEEGKPHARAAPASAPPNPVAAAPEARRPPRPATAPAHEGGPPLSPVVRRLLAEHGVDASAIAGSGAGGRITRDDVLAHVEQRKGGVTPQAVERVPLNRIRKRTAEQMALSWRTIPHVLQAVEVDFQSVDRARLARAESWKAEEGWALTYLPFVAFAVCRALPDFPAVNASFDGDALVLHRRINLGIAVDLGGEGLIVPVVKDAAGKSLPDLARDIYSVSEKARAGRLAPDDVTEATYTLSNSGSFGTLLTAPIINPPQVAILSTDAVTNKPVADGNGVAIHPVGVLAQSFDHRAFDGAYSAAFLRKVKQTLEGRDWAADLIRGR
jgi:2-oxoglutarate dehydrogenase E2 component (dihydrolipoamide succinyltransferase)